MNSQIEDVLHKTQFTKIAKNSPKSNQDECLEPPSYFESFFLDKSGQSSNKQTQNIQDKINQFIYENCNQWIDAYESTKAQQISYSKKKQIINQEIKSVTQFALLINCMLTLLNNIFNAFLALLFPYIVLLEESENNQYLCYFLLFYILIISLTYTYCQYLQTKQSEKQLTISILDLIDPFITVNILLVGLLIIYIMLNFKILVTLLSCYYFYEGYNQIEKFFKLLIIQKKKWYNYLAVLKIIIYYIYLLHLFACLIYSDEFQLNYKDSLFMIINFFTFQANYYTTESNLNLSIIFSQIVGLIMLFKTLDIIIQIRLNNVELQNKPNVNVYILHYYIWNHQGNIFLKFQTFSQLANNNMVKKELTQSIMKNIYKQIVEDYLEISHMFTKQFTVSLSERIKVLRKSKEIDQNNNIGLYIILRGQAQVSYKKEGLKQYEQNMVEKVFGLIDCFQKNISDIKLIFNDELLVLYISEEDFKSCLNSNQDLETFHMIKNKILFEGNTSSINYRCLICQGYHLMSRCQVYKDIQKLILKDYNQENERSKWYRNQKRKQYAYEIYVKKIGQQISVTANSESVSESNSSSEQFQICLDELTESQKQLDKNLIVGNSKGTITIPTISKDGYGDFISDKILLEQLKSSHKHISMQPSSIQPGSQQIGDFFRSDPRSQQLYPSLFKFQDILAIDDIDTIREYMHFYPEFNISYIIQQLQN